MSRTSFYCPHCFDLVRICDLEYCDPKCNQIITHTPSIMERVGLASPPRSVPCPESVRSRVNNDKLCRTCSRMVTQKICPLCKGVLPATIDDLSDITIAIIGAKGSGKSHYVALLVDRIKKLFRTFGWTLQALTDETIENYKTHFYTPLFLAQVPLQTTRRGKPEPLMYSLKFHKGNKRVMLVFFDAAGEHFNNAADMQSMNRYISNASGIICLMDPLQLPEVRRELQDRNVPLPDQATNVGEILDRLKNLINAKGKIKTPLALAFSKMDALRTNDPDYCGRILFDGNTSMIYQDSSYQGCIRKEELETIHCTLESWLEVVEPDILQACEKEFQDYKLFGFSALGEPPVQEKGGLKLGCPPRPFRVEDPFLWILAVNGLIKIK